MQLALTGAAPISPELIRWYQTIGVPLREGWGMTETTGDVGQVDADGYFYIMIEKVNRDFARVEQIKQFRLIEQRLTADDEAQALADQPQVRRADRGYVQHQGRCLSWPAG